MTRCAAILFLTVTVTVFFVSMRPFVLVGHFPVASLAPYLHARTDFVFLGGGVFFTDLGFLGHLPSASLAPYLHVYAIYYCNTIFIMHDTSPI
jgi:hypothetical protein